MSHPWENSKAVPDVRLLANHTCKACHQPLNSMNWNPDCPECLRWKQREYEAIRNMQQMETPR